MLKTTIFLLCFVAILVSGTNDTPTLPTVSTTSSSTNASTTDQPSSVSTTEINTSTTSSSSTNPPTTTVVTSTTVSTLAPTSTPTPTPAPTPVPPPETGKWSVNGTTELCIIAQMALQFNVSYVTQKNETVSKVLNLPVNNTVAQGMCGTAADTEQNITLTWNATNLSSAQNVLTLHFFKNITKYQYTLHHLEVSFAPAELPDIKDNSTAKFVHISDQFTTGLNNSYRCLKTQTLNLTTANNETGEIRVSNLQFQAFHIDKTLNFGFAEDCAFDTPDIVPIAVGCALAALVVIVLVAYLVGRRRSQARGYLSM